MKKCVAVIAVLGSVVAAQAANAQTDFTVSSASAVLGGGTVPDECQSICPDDMITWCRDAEPCVPCASPGGTDCHECHEVVVASEIVGIFGPDDARIYRTLISYGLCPNTNSLGAHASAGMGPIGSVVTASFNVISTLSGSCGGTTSSTNNSSASFVVPARGFVEISVSIQGVNETISCAAGAFDGCPDRNPTSATGFTVGSVTVTSAQGDSSYSDNTPGPNFLVLRDDLVASGSEVSVFVNMIGDVAGGGDCEEKPLTADAFISARFRFVACTFLADINGDDMLTPADFTAWVNAFNNGDLLADQNGDGVLTAADFNAWVFNFNNGIGC